jgi:hypothetical protein
VAVPTFAIPLDAFLRLIDEVDAQRRLTSPAIGAPGPSDSGTWLLLPESATEDWSLMFALELAVQGASCRGVAFNLERPAGQASR